MKTTLSLWWSFFWRYIVLLFLIAFSAGVVMTVFHTPSGYRPSIGWWLTAVILLGIALVREGPEAVLWGRRLALPSHIWRRATIWIAALYFMLAVLNMLAFAFLPPHTWILFKFAVPLPALMMLIYYVAYHARNARLHTHAHTQMPAPPAP